MKKTTLAAIIAFAAYGTCMAVETAVEETMPGEPSTKKAISPAPFPDRISAYVWRNWFLVPHARLAETIGAKESDITAVAVEMGLPAKVEVLPEWRRKGYITVLRRNWHLLDYPQLLEVLDMTRKELKFSLQEDDFLFHKLGSMKPLCGPLRWDAAAVASTRPARLKIAGMLKEEGVDIFEEEPRFKFTRDLSRVTPGMECKADARKDMPFDFRLIFSYFADYGDPLGDPDVASYPEGLIQKLAAQGVNAVWLHTVLRTLAKDPKYPEFGEGSEMRMANLRKLIARCGKYGVKVYLYMNEPRAMPLEFFEKTPERAAMRGTPDASMPIHAMCTSVPEVRRWVRDSLEKVFRDAPGLGGIFTITMSENLTNCASRGGKGKCPRCRGRDSSEIVAEINRAMIEGMAAGNPDATALVWNWAWNRTDSGPARILELLPKKNIRIMAVSENSMKFNRGGITGEEGDYAISIVGPGEKAKELWALARANGQPTVAKVQANCSWELSSFPYLPVADLVAEHAVNLVREGVDGVMLSWSLGCCPAPNLSIFRDVRKTDTDKGVVLNRLAADLYGEKAVPMVREAWSAFAEGFREFPFSVGVLYCGPQQWGPANPLYMEPTGYAATMVGMPYDDFKRWRSIYPEDIWISQMEKVEAGFVKGCELFEAALADIAPAKRAAAARELAMFKAEMLHFRSCVDQARFVQARNNGDKAEMARLAKREMATAKAILPLVRADSRFGYESSNHYFYTPQDLREKIVSCRVALEKTAANRRK